MEKVHLYTGQLSQDTAAQGIRDLGRVVSYLVINPRIPGYKTGDRPGSLDRIKRTAAVVVGHLFESLYTTTKVLTLGQSLEFRTLTTMPYVGSRRSPTTMFYKPEPELDTP